MRSDLANIREGLSSPEAQRLIDERPSLSALSKDITAAIVLLECAEAKVFKLLPMEETMWPGNVAAEIETGRRAGAASDVTPS
jgi:hypothetical protein